MWACGSNAYGQLGDGTTTNRSTPVKIGITGVQQVYVGGGHTIFLKSNGEVWACGANAYGQLGDGTTTNRSTPVLIFRYPIITFETNGGTSISTQTIAFGAKATKPSDPTRTNYIFGGWYSDNSLTMAYDFNTAVNSDKTLYAKWTLNQYTVMFNSNGGTMVTSQEINHGGKVIEPKDPTKKKHIFGGWYSDNVLMTTYDFNTAVNSDKTLYAKWTLIQYTVTFNSDGGTMVTSQQIDHGSNVTKPSDPTKKNYIFDGWYSDNSLTTAYDFNTAVNSDKILYAKWTLNQYTVTFNSDGGTTETSQQIYHGSMATKPSDPTRTNYIFGGWYSDNSLTTAYDFNTAVNSDKTLYAKWTLNQYTVTFNSDGGTTETSQQIYHGSMATKPSDPTRTNYIFGGWYSDNSLTTAYDFNTAVNSDKTLYAKWTLNQYTVTFNSDGGTTETSQQIYHGSMATKPNDPTKTGYIFGGWYSDNSLTTAYDFNTAVNSDKILYAKWICTLTFNSNIITNVSCYGGSDGSISIKDIIGGSGEYTILVNGLDNVDLINLVSGTYVIKIRDSKGCESVKKTLTIKEPKDSITFKYNINGRNVEIIDVKGTREDYNIIVNEEEINGDLKNLVAGKYVIKIRDVNNCESSEKKIIINNEIFENIFTSKLYNKVTIPLTFEIDYKFYRIDLKIFNSSGNVMINKRNIDENYLKNNINISMGTYFYIVRVYDRKTNKFIGIYQNFIESVKTI